MGAVAVAQDALHGAHTQRALDNLPIEGALPRRFVHALLLVKAAAARANTALGVVDARVGAAIFDACGRLLADPEVMRCFPVGVFQTGSGTSSNMNANEVIATLASRAYGRAVRPNDDVNASQSSNDVIPSAIHVAATLALRNELLPALDHLARTIRAKARGVRRHVKTGRTHLMDAMPVRMDQVLGGWAAMVEQDAALLRALCPALQRLAQGGSAVGTGVNVPPRFVARFHAELRALTGVGFEPARDSFAALGSQGTALAVSGQLKATAASVMKIAADLRWMNSGPLAGLAEIELEALQPGSSIMPGKVNPVVAEAAQMACAQVIGNDAAITIAAQSGNFELNTMLPLVARNLVESIALLAAVSRLLGDKAIASFKVNTARLDEALARNPILVTALNPIIGYEEAARIAKRAYAERRPIIDVAVEMSGLSRERLEKLLDPLRLTGAR